ncbi:24034_t:CDS:2, partial [Racocetra persica]
EKDIDLIKDKSPEWSVYDDCYGSEGEFCKSCSCSVCKWKGDPGCILLCNGCEKGFHTRCLKPLLKRIPARKWYCNELNVSIIQLDINAQRIVEIENTLVIQSDINTQESILQHDNSRSSLFLHLENQIKDLIDHEDNMSNENDMSFEDSQSLQ